MEKTSRKIVQYIEENIELDNSQKEVIIFGLQATLEIGLNIIISVLVLCKMHMLKEGFFFFAVFIPLRKYSGGYHANTYVKCFIISIVGLIAIMKASNMLKISNMLMLILIMLLSYMLWKIGPVCVTERPVSKQEYCLFKEKLSETISIILFLSLFLVIIEKKTLLNILFLSICLDIVTVIGGKIKYCK